MIDILSNHCSKHIDLFLSRDEPLLFLGVVYVLFFPCFSSLKQSGAGNIFLHEVQQIPPHSSLNMSTEPYCLNHIKMGLRIITKIKSIFSNVLIFRQKQSITEVLMVNG
jgi:hypothetical protein